MCVASLALIFTRSVGKSNWPSEDQCQRSHSKWVFVFIPDLKSKYSQLIISKLSRKSVICPRRSPWWFIVLARSLSSALLNTAWLVKSVTYFNLIGGCVREFQRSKYKFSSHPKTLELTGKCGVINLALFYMYSTDRGIYQITPSSVEMHMGRGYKIWFNLYQTSGFDDSTIRFFRR